MILVEGVAPTAAQGEAEIDMNTKTWDLEQNCRLKLFS